MVNAATTGTIVGFLGFGRRKHRAPAPQPVTAPSPEASAPHGVVAAEPEPVAAAPTPTAEIHPAGEDHTEAASVEPQVDHAPEEPVAPAAPSPAEALQLLKDGNEAFVAGTTSLGHVTAHDLEPLAAGQHPIAVIVGCADSRTPPTILFNQGLGRLFIIRVAGNTVDGRGLASVVYAVKHLHCPLVVVMGHSGCGAVAAAEAIVDGAPLDPSLEEMITPIIPAVLAARRKSPADPACAAVEENARWVAEKLASADSNLAEAVEAGTVKIVAAVKDMATGRVAFLD